MGKGHCCFLSLASRKKEHKGSSPLMPCWTSEAQELKERLEQQNKKESFGDDDDEWCHCFASQHKGRCHDDEDDDSCP